MVKRAHGNYPKAQEDHPEKRRGQIIFQQKQKTNEKQGKKTKKKE